MSPTLTLLTVSTLPRAGPGVDQPFCILGAFVEQLACQSGPSCEKGREGGMVAIFTQATRLKPN